MNIIDKILLLIKNMFKKQNELKKLNVSTQVINKDQEVDFIESLKINNENTYNKKIETLICPGDGLGIQKKIRF